MKRKLTEKEANLSNKNLERLKKELTELESNLEYNKGLIEKQNNQRDFDDKWRDYLRNRKDEEDNKILQVINDKIEETKLVIERTQKELNEGTDLPNVIDG